MTNETNALSALLEAKKQLKLEISNTLIETCFEVEKKHQFDKDRNTIPILKKHVENYLTEIEELK